LKQIKVAENKLLFDHFISLKPTIENEPGRLDLKSEFPWMTRCARFYADKTEGRMAEELKDWAIETTLRFYSVFKLRLDKFLRS